jgi:hypothetical protein
VRRQKHGTLRSGSGGRVRSRKQAIAIGLSEAREKGAKAPAPPGRRSAKKKRATKRRASTRASAARSTRRTGTSRKTSRSRKSSGSRKR